MNKLIFAKDDLKEPTDEYLVIDKWYEKLLEADFPLSIEVVKHADDPLHSVSKGCLIAASISEESFDS